MKIIWHYAAMPRLQRRFDELAAEGLDISACPEADDATLQELLPAAEAIWHVLKPVTAAVMDAAPNLRLVQKIGVGVNTIDLDAARARGISVCNMPGTNSQAVAELTLLLMLSVLRRHGPLDHATRVGEGWRLGPAWQGHYGEIHGRTIGLVGYGEIPRRLAPALAALGGRVIYTATSPKDDAIGEWRSLDDLIAESDILSLHLPITPETHHMINRESLARMKPGSYVINTARGQHIDHAALIDALESGHLAGAGFDVYAEEPVDPADPLLARDDVVLMPHMAWLTPETLERSLEVAAENCRRLRAGAPLLNQIV